jgi:hypothetical protein
MPELTISLYYTLMISLFTSDEKSSGSAFRFKFPQTFCRHLTAEYWQNKLALCVRVCVFVERIIRAVGSGSFQIRFHLRRQIAAAATRYRGSAYAL